MNTFYDPGPLPGWPIGRPAGAEPKLDGPAESAMPNATSATDTMDTPKRRLELEVVAPAASGSPGAVRRPGESSALATLGKEREARVRALRDAVREAAARLQASEPVSLRAFHDTLSAACAALVAGDLGSDVVTIGQQFDALFERLRELADAHVEPVPTSALGLATDARFLHDMAEFLTRNFTLDGEE